MVCDGQRLLLRRCYYLEGQALTGIFFSSGSEKERNISRVECEPHVRAHASDM